VREAIREAARRGWGYVGDAGQFEADPDGFRVWLDDQIRVWRRFRNSHPTEDALRARIYLDALQTVRTRAFGSDLPEDG
jgi:hypothetical protein